MQHVASKHVMMKARSTTVVWSPDSPRLGYLSTPLPLTCFHRTLPLLTGLTSSILFPKGLHTTPLPSCAPPAIRSVVLCTYQTIPSQLDTGALFIPALCIIHDKKLLGFCGETQLANAKQSIITVMQVYEYFISHHMPRHSSRSLVLSPVCLVVSLCTAWARTTSTSPCSSLTR